MTDPRERKVYSRNLTRHLSELSCLLKRTVAASDLMSVGDTATLRERGRVIDRKPSWRVDLPFAALRERRFEAFLATLERLVPSSVFLWTPLAPRCGVLQVGHLTAIDFGFDFDAIPEGIISIVTSDLIDKLVLDFSEEGGNERTVELEVSGPRWGAARY